METSGDGRLYVSDRRVSLCLFSGRFREREAASDYWVSGIH